MAKEMGHMSVSEAGQKGGERTSKAHGHGFYHKIGTKGGRGTSRSHGPEFYHEIGAKGGKRVKELIEEGKKLEKRVKE